MIGATSELIGLLPLKQQLGLLALSPRRRKRLVNKVTKFVIRDSKARVRKQVDLQGRPFAARKKKRARKMLSGLAKKLKVIELTAQHGVAGFYDKKAGRIAYDHQHGKVSVVSAKDQPNISGQNDKPATRKQAKALLDLDFKIRRASGKGLKKPSIKHVVANYSRGHAGQIIRAMRIKAGDTPKKQWTTVLPARSFVGATPNEVTQYISMIFSDMKKEIQHAR